MTRIKCDTEECMYWANGECIAGRIDISEDASCLTFEFKQNMKEERNEQTN